MYASHNNHKNTSLIVCNSLKFLMELRKECFRMLFGQAVLLTFILKRKFLIFHDYFLGEKYHWNDRRLQTPFSLEDSLLV